MRRLVPGDDHRALFSASSTFVLGVTRITDKSCPEPEGRASVAFTRSIGKAKAMTGAWVGPPAVALLQASFTRPTVSAFAFASTSNAINARSTTVANVVDASRANLVAVLAVVAFVTYLAGLRDRVDKELLRAHTNPRR